MAMTAKKILSVILVIFSVCIMFSHKTSATENSFDIEYSDEYQNFTEYIPSEIIPLLPDGIFSENENEKYAAAKEISGFTYILNTILSFCGAKMGDALKMLCGLCGIILLSACINALKQSLCSPTLGEPLNICINVVLLATVLNMQSSIIKSVSMFLERLSMLVNSMIPLISVLYACGGNVNGASASASSLGIFIAICENLCSKTLIPIVSICLSFSAVSVFTPGINLGSLARAIKKTYTFLLGFVMLVFSVVMGAQTALAAKADSLSARAAKYAVSSFIPIVGGTIGDSLRTIAASIEYIRGSVGIIAIIIIILLLLPILTSLIFSRLAVTVSSSIASMLGCETEGKLLDELSNIYGYMVAICCFCSVLFIYALTIFVRTSAAIA